MSLSDFGRQLAAMEKAAPAFMDKVVVEEGQYARDWAVKLARQKRYPVGSSKEGKLNLHNTGTYINNFHSGDTAIRSGDYYKIDVFNNVDYAEHIEYGFRSHWVPGYFAGKTFVYQKGFPGGMYVGPKNGFVKGSFIIRTAVEYTKQTQDARLERKLKSFFKQYGYT
jgi:hypothetical protein